eukprot:scaffold19.g1855.t1
MTSAVAQVHVIGLTRASHARSTPAAGLRANAARPQLTRRSHAERRALAPPRAAEPPAASAAAAPPSFAATPLLPASGELPDAAGVYAVFDESGTLQFVGLSRRINISVATHVEALPELVGSVKVWELPGGSKEELMEAWKEWIQAAVAETGTVPPGNAPGETKWQQRRARPARPEMKMTPGKGLEVVAFIKGTRTAPQCGFSYKVLTLLTETGADYEVVNVLDEVWGEFIGGADIVEQLAASGELRQMVADAGALRK